ncbi:ribonuclease III domain-containing protein [Ruminococcus sp.]|uniref:Mini-ribonuclease 3 n=1 Tax=Ruminococcus sp. TaxID=41978 RepID=UPI0025FC0324|nr:ribonuclease III domain-containing protein [Ruminococcus sp.]MBQ8965306.1 ribonuclease III [Ruminococcus sp.]
MHIEMTRREANQYSPLALAFIGDSVYEQLVRERIILAANMPANKLHKLAVSRVCAEYQSECVELLLENGTLTEGEQEVFKRGRNTKVNAPKHSTIAQYRNATGLECLFGYLYLTAQLERIDVLFDICWEHGKEEFNEKIKE